MKARSAIVMIIVVKIAPTTENHFDLPSYSGGLYPRFISSPSEFSVNLQEILWQLFNRF